MGNDARSVRDKKLAFAKAYADVTGPAFHNATEAYLVAVSPGVSRESAGRAGLRYLKDPVVQEELLRLGDEAGHLNALTLAEYIQRCVERADQMLAAAMREIPGAAAAAAKYDQMVGQALGAFVRRVEDVTPKDRRAPTVAVIVPQGASSHERLDAIEAAIRQMRELNEPNPIAGQLPTPSQEAVEEHVTIEPSDDDDVDVDDDEDVA
jgi:phage terminase small subunit